MFSILKNKDHINHGSILRGNIQDPNAYFLTIFRYYIKIKRPSFLFRLLFRPVEQ